MVMAGALYTWWNKRPKTGSGLVLCTIAGYSSSASRLLARSHDDLVKAKRSLSRSFFDQHPEHEVYKAHISETDTPQLYRELSAAEELRLALLDMLKQY